MNLLGECDPTGYCYLFLLNSTIFRPAYSVLLPESRGLRYRLVLNAWLVGRAGSYTSVSCERNVVHLVGAQFIGLREEGECVSLGFC